MWGGKTAVNKDNKTTAKKKIPLKIHVGLHTDIFFYTHFFFHARMSKSKCFHFMVYYSSTMECIHSSMMKIAMIFFPFVIYCSPFIHRFLYLHSLFPRVSTLNNLSQSQTQLWAHSIDQHWLFLRILQNGANMFFAKCLFLYSLFRCESKAL